MIPDNPCPLPFQGCPSCWPERCVFCPFTGYPKLSTKNSPLFSSQCQGTLCCFLEISLFPLSLSLGRVRTTPFCPFTWLFRGLEGTCHQGHWETHQPLSLMLEYLDDSLLIRSAHPDSVSVGTGSKTRRLPLPQKPTQKTMEGSFLSSLTRHVWWGGWGEGSHITAAGKEISMWLVLGPRDAGPTAPEFALLPLLQAHATRAPGNHLHAVAVKRACFPSNFLLLLEASKNRHVVLFGCRDFKKKKKKLYVYTGQIYLFLKVNYLCLTTQVLLLQKKAFAKHVCYLFARFQWFILWDE